MLMMRKGSSENLTNLFPEDRHYASRAIWYERQRAVRLFSRTQSLTLFLIVSVVMHDTELTRTELFERTGFGIPRDGRPQSRLQLHFRVFAE
jgi:hypothetical protein